MADHGEIVRERTLSIDYVGRQLDDSLFQSLIDLLREHGRTPGSVFDGPADDFGSFYEATPARCNEVVVNGAPMYDPAAWDPSVFVRVEPPVQLLIERLEDFVRAVVADCSPHATTEDYVALIRERERLAEHFGSPTQGGQS